MKPYRFRSAAWALFALPWLLAGAIAQAANSGVRDTAGFFSNTAKENATKTIAEIQSTLRKDLLIETFSEIPADQRRGVDLQDKAAVNRLYETWSVQRARELGINGIYILLTRQPAHLQIAVGNQTQRQAFKLSDRDVLASRMLEKLRAKQNDEALIAGVSFVQSTLRSHQVSAARTPSTPSKATTAASPSSPPYVGEETRRAFSPLSLLLPILLIGGVIFIVMRIIGAFLGRGAVGGNPSGFGGGGGGFLRSMLGGVFGAAAGMWLYDMFTGHHNNAWGSNTPPTPGGTDNGFAGQDTDYSSSGGDFGDSSGGGGDFGGGGGDFGGGGGGGDF